MGDLIALYVTRPQGQGRIPAILEVTHEPYDGRDRVAAEVSVDDAAKYGWVTHVTPIRQGPIADAPTIDVVGKTTHSLQGGRTRVADAAAFARLESMLPLLV